ncbi:MAG: alcohol dehydrogenase catalytic domain-containing protein [Trueperaceae bacterium]
MRAIVVDAPNAQPTLRDVPEPTPAPDGAVIEVRATGVCRSDWHAWVGHDPTVAWPHVPGHEFAGVVRAVGERVRSVRLGERVTAPFCCGCGSCGPCRDGVQNLCEREYQPGFDGWGSFSEAVHVPWADVNVARLPDAIGFDEAAALGCRFMTAFAGLTDRAGLRPGETVCIYGCGGVGLSAVLIALAAGAQVVAIDVRDEPLQLARELAAAVRRGDAAAGPGAPRGTHAGRNDALVTVNARTHDPVATVRDVTDGGAHLSVDALGSPATCAQAIRSLRRRGRHLQLGLLLGEDAAPVVPMFEVIRHELTVLGGHGMPARRYPELFRFVEARGLPIDRLVGEIAPLDAAGDALSAVGRFAPVGATVLRP